MHLFDYFDFLAPVYERFITSSISDELRDLLTPLPGQVILDAAGGTGRIAQALKNASVEVVVADYSHNMLRQAYKKGGLQPVRTQIEALPFPTGTFDRILMVDALHHVSNQVDTALELWRVLKPYGRIVIEEPDIDTLTGKVIALGEKLAGMHSHFLDSQKIQGLFSPFSIQVQAARADHNIWVVIEKTD